ncbi:hypothetical protein DTO166G4_1809 [Paecilomyces variotii]|nr:hypothetical protein DTO166G4_1809 [Paecilomyces variotii]KAJ9239565.1 hypothetical protein DTO166G5_2312 [Paecilomyces variotii]KAJ9251425.1 hypothetical protein DTO195F2_7814 [Paecilomyces variotii]KAJ9255009.1 hypothetical protein DTO212C5_9195 [Paecilomyces variotii]KAJ9355817.1 hypothetical protein DTO027B9_3971 [Paecilomyces variotii]
MPPRRPPGSTPSLRFDPPGSSPRAPIIVPSEASSDSNNDAEELLRQLRGLLDEFRRLIVSLEAALR